MDPKDIKKYPSSSNSIAETLKLKSTSPVANLPGVDQAAIEAQSSNSIDEARLQADVEAIAGKARTGTLAAKALKSIVPYVLIFGVGIFLYYYYFTDFTLHNLFKRTPTAATVTLQTNSALNALMKSESVNYQAWISQFYFEVSDPKVIDPTTDNSGNGLTNFQKYVLGLNPKAYDTLGLGRSDTQSLKEGINPLTGGPLTSYQREVIQKYLNLEVVQDKGSIVKSVYAYNEVIPAVSEVTVGSPDDNKTSLTAGRSVTQTVSPKTPKQTLKQPAQTKTVATPAPHIPLLEQGFNKLNLQVGLNTQHIDFAKPGKLAVPDLGISVPLVWTQDLSTIDKDLESGVVHFPGTPFPGDIGTSYVSGHSSGYAWSKGDYNHVFTNLGDLPDNARFTISATTLDGKPIIFYYTLVRRGEFKPGDQNQFANTANSEVALSTCWPIGGTAKRLVIYGSLTKIEK